MKLLQKNVMALAVFAVSLVVLLLNVQPLPHQGQSAVILSQKLGIDPLPAFASPVYGWVVQAISLVSGAHVLWAVNAFSALCGSLVLALVFVFVYRLARMHNADKVLGPPAVHKLQIAAGIVSTLYLLASGPFTLAATRANPMMFDLLLLMVPFYLVLSASKEKNPVRLPLAALIYGVAIVEFSTAIVLAPIFAVLILSRLWIANTFTINDVSKVFLAGAAGLLVYLIQAGLYTATPAYVWREFASYFEVIWYIWVEQKNELTRSLPRVGWLTLALVSIIPWIITSTMRMSRKTVNNSGATMGIASLNFMLGILAVLLLVDNFPLAPVSLTGTRRLFVTPYLIISLWVGSVAAFWLVLLFSEKRFEPVVLTKLRRGLGVGVLVGIPLYLVYIIATSSLPQTFDQDDRLAYGFSKEVVDVAAEKEWLITNTPFDDLISIEIYRRQLPLKMMRLSYGRSTAYMKYIANYFSDTPRLKSLAGVGLAPFMDEWFARDPDIDEKASVVHVPDMWLIAGLEAVPDQVLFSGVKAAEELDLDEVIARNEALWNRFGARVVEAVSDEVSQSSAAYWISLHLSKLANNLGVFLEDRGRPEDALDCYKKARIFAPENLSALMNLHVLSEKLGLPEFAAYERELIKRAETLVGKVQTWTLSYVYGFVRVPELFINRGMAFAMSGKANMAITDLKKSLKLQEDNPQAQMALAELYFSQDKNEESASYYRNVVEANPDNTTAILGLMRIATRQGKYDEAREHLTRLKELRFDSEALKLEEAVLESFDGAPLRSMELLREVVKENPDNMKAWAAIAIAAAELNDAESGEEAIRRLRNANVLNPNIQIVMAQSALDQNDRDGARRYLNEILRVQPGNIRAMEMMLRMDLSEGNDDAVRSTVDKLLLHDPANAFGNFMLGRHHYHNEEYELAESAFRASAESRRAPETLNDLAYVLYIQGELGEAERYIRESLELNEGSSSAWDTLGVVLMEQGQLEEAESALVHSLGIRPGAASVMLSLARLYEKQGRWNDAEELAGEVRTMSNDLPSLDQVKLSDLQQRLEDRR